MELMKTVAKKHHMHCLLHEKPFDGVNGSGKHNNWSLSTDTGKNLLEPGDTPSQNAQFLLFLTAVIEAVDRYQGLLRFSVASAGNDHRLGANEAPPAIISVYVGDELDNVIKSIIDGTDYTDKSKKMMSIGATVLPHIPQDTTDRNRTSPFAFTGNKFEFRSLGSNASIASPNIVLNTIVAEVLSEYADELEKAADFDSALSDLVRKHLTDHKRIIFEGNGYSEDWVKEAEKRGLRNLPSTVEATEAFVEPESIEVFTKNKVYTETEIRSRYEISFENYYKQINIEAQTLSDMTKDEIIGAALRYEEFLANTINDMKATGTGIPTRVEEKLLQQAADMVEVLYDRLQKLDADIAKEDDMDDVKELASYNRYTILPDMDSLREVIDELESRVPHELWPYPTYGELLYSVQ